MNDEMIQEATFRTRRQIFYLMRGLFRRGLEGRKVYELAVARRGRIYERQLAAVRREWAKKEQGR